MCRRGIKIQTGSEENGDKGNREWGWTLGIPERGLLFSAKPSYNEKNKKEVSADAVPKMFRPDGNKPNQNPSCMGG